MVVSLTFCGEGWLWFVVSLYFMCACVSYVELDLFVLIDSVFGIACFSQFFSFMVYHLFEVVFISLVVLYLYVSQMTIAFWVPREWKESAGIYCCLFVVLMYVFTLSLSIYW